MIKNRALKKYMALTDCKRNFCAVSLNINAYNFEKLYSCSTKETCGFLLQ